MVEPQATGLYLKLLGIPRAFWQGQEIETPSAKPFALLCYLAASNHPRSRKELAELLWSAGKTSSVRVALHTLKQLPHADTWLMTEAQQVSVMADSDVWRFEQAVEDHRLAEALDIWAEAQGMFLQNLEVRGVSAFDEWLEQERERLDALYQNTLKQHAFDLEEAKDFEAAIALANRVLAKDPLDENAHRAIMRMEHARGNLDEALEQFDLCQKILKAELDAEPLPETLELLTQIQQGGVTQAKSALLLSKAEDIPTLPSKLIGRDEILTQVLADLDNHARLLLQGLGGAGKTAIASTLAANYAKKNKKVLWLQVGNDEPDTLFDALARPFEAQKEINQASDKATVMRSVFSKEQVDLLVLDDVWNAYALGKVLEALPNETALLITARQRYPKLKRLDIGRLEREASLELLGHFSEQDVAQDSDANDLCENLGDHAFSLRIAGVTMAVDKLSAKTLKNHIVDSPHALKLPEEFKEEGRDSFTSLMNVSLQALSDEAYEAFMAMGCLFTPSCTPELLAICIRRGENDVEGALIELQKRALVERVTEAGSDVVSYRLHDLAFSLAKANNNIRTSTLIQACDTFIKKHKQDFDMLDAEISNSLSAWQEVKTLDNYDLLGNIVRCLVVDTNTYFNARGHTPRSIHLLEQSLELALEKEDVVLSHHLAFKLGKVYHGTLGDMDRAFDAYGIALENAKRLQKIEKNSVKNDALQREAITLNLLGITQFKRKAPDFERYLQEAYHLAQKHHDLLALSQILPNMGYVEAERQNFSRAYALCYEAVEVTEKLASASTIDQALANQNLFYALLNLGEAEKELGRFEDSLKSRKRALALARMQDNEPKMAYALQEIAEFYHDQEDRKKAEKHYNQALDLYQQNHAKADIDALKAFMKQENYEISCEMEIVEA